MPGPDVKLMFHGSVALITPLTEPATSRVADRVVVLPRHQRNSIRGLPTTEEVLERGTDISDKVLRYLVAISHY
jgi:hypothetical protein